MCGIVGAASARNIVPILIDGIRRLEYRGYDSTGLAVIDGRRRRRALVAARQHGARRRPRRAGRSARISPAPPASRTRAGRRTARRRRSTRTRTSPAARSPSCTTASSRTSRRCATRLVGAGLRVRARRPTPRSSRTSCTRTGTARRAATCCARCSAAVAEFHGRLRDRGDLDARAGPRRRRAAGQPAGRRARRGRPLPRLRRRGAAVGHAARRLSRGRRRRRRAPRGATRSTTRSGARVERADRHRRGVGRRASSSGPYRHFMQKEIFEQPRAVADTLEGVDGDRAGAVRRRTRDAVLRATSTAC